MIRKITIFAALLALAVGAEGRNRSVASGSPGTTADAALFPITVPGASVSGVVSSVAGNIISLAGGLVTLDASSAKITDQKGTSGTIASITPGSTVYAVLSSATAAANAPLPAVMINVHRIPQVELTGTVTAVGTNTLTVLGRTITVDANTSFGGRARGLSEIFVNDTAIVAANVSGSSLLASSVLSSTPIPKSTIIHGTVKSIGAEAWTISDRDGKEWTIVVNSQTKVVGDPKVGDTVEILANIDSANRYVALSILKSSITVKPVVNFSGEVKSITATSWVVRDSRADKEVTLAITADTKIVGDPKVADGVNVTATIEANGTYTALAILKLGIVPPPLNVTVRGVVKSITGLACIGCDDTVWVVGPAVGLGPDTQFRSNSRTKISGSPRTGDTVEAVLQSTAAGYYLALSIVKQ